MTAYKTVVSASLSCIRCFTLNRIAKPMCCTLLQAVRAYERLREELTPMYESLFQNLVAELDSGIDFVVKLREDLLDTIAATASTTAAASTTTAAESAAADAADSQQCTVQHLKVCAPGSHCTQICYLHAARTRRCEHIIHYC
jgi:Malonyl-CoA decarboxylase N-terminal domain